MNQTLKLLFHFFSLVLAFFLTNTLFVFCEGVNYKANAQVLLLLRNITAGL